MEVNLRAKLFLTFALVLCSLFFLSISLNSDELNVLLEGKVKWFDVQNGQGYLIKEGWWTNSVFRYNKGKLSRILKFASDNYCLEGNELTTINGTKLTVYDLSVLPVKPVTKNLRYPYKNYDYGNEKLIRYENHLIYDCVVEGELRDNGIVCIDLNTMNKVLLVREIYLWWLEGSQIRYVHKSDTFDTFDLSSMYLENIRKPGSDIVIDGIEGGLINPGDQKTIPIPGGVFIESHGTFIVCDSDLKLKNDFSWNRLIDMTGETISNDCVYYSQRQNTGSREALLFPKFFAKENGLWVWNWKDNSQKKLRSSTYVDLEVSGDKVYGRDETFGRMYSIDRKTGEEMPVWK